MRNTLGRTEHTMPSEFQWTCPFCGRDTTITAERQVNDYTDLDISNAEGTLRLRSQFIVCPNPQCKRTSLSASLHKRGSDQFGQRTTGERLHYWRLIPSSNAMQLPGYVPAAIVQDYEEACLIQDLSPKASATLSRRCLQGVLRDFWKVKPGRLVDEIEAIRDKTDPLTWDAIDSVRKVGNIGAHMERDIDVIVDVDPGEAELLIDLIETLVRDWYIAREQRRERLEAIKLVADKKDAARRTPPASS